MEVLAVGTFWFWIALVVVNIAIVASVEWDSGFWATCTLLATIAGLHFFSDVPIFTMLYYNWHITLMGVIGYVGFGCVTAIGKWTVYSRRERRRYDELREVFVQELSQDTGEVLTAIPADRKNQWYWRFTNAGITHNPEVKNYKNRIYLWITYWPWVWLWTLLNDPIRKVCQVCYDTMRHSLQRISDNAFAGTEGDFETPAKKKSKPKS